MSEHTSTYDGLRSHRRSSGRCLLYSVSVILTVCAFAVFTALVIVLLNVESKSNDAVIWDTLVWHYECRSQQCIKLPITTTTSKPIGLVQCRQTCGPGDRSKALDVWPNVHGPIRDNGTIKIVPIWLPKLRFDHVGHSVDDSFWQTNHKRLLDQIRAKRAARKLNSKPYPAKNGQPSAVTVTFMVASDDANFHMAVNETYRLSVGPLQLGGTIAVTIEAETIFGARHGIETLSQLVIYDDLNDRYLVRRTPTIRLELYRTKYDRFLLFTAAHRGEF